MVTITLEELTDSFDTNQFKAATIRWAQKNPAEFAKLWARVCIKKPYVTVLTKRILKDRATFWNEYFKDFSIRDVNNLMPGLCRDREEVQVQLAALLKRKRQLSRRQKKK